MSRTIKAGIAQFEAVHLNLASSLEKLESIVEQAAQEQVQVLVFGETWLSGYPAWLDHCPQIAQWDSEATKSAFLQLRNNSLTVPGKETARIATLAKERQMAIVIGVNERVDHGPGNGTIYNSLLTFDASGNLANHHRKLMPTFTEKMLYGMGDGHGLKTVNTQAIQLGGLICWEHWMPLTRQALHNATEDIHAAVWPVVHEKHQIASRHYAFEGRCFVLAAGQLIRVKDFPQGLLLPDHLMDKPDQFVCTGGSCIINPRGEFIVEPVFNKEVLLTAELDIDQRIKEQMTLDITGHYQRNDIFDFAVNKSRKS